MLSVVKKLATIGRDTPEALAAEIAKVEAEARVAREQSKRAAEKAAVELDDDAAEEMLRDSRAQDRAARRAEARLPELRERLAAADWEKRQQLFEEHRRDLIAAARQAIKFMETAAAANANSAAAREAALRTLGSAANAFPAVVYGGLCLPDLVALWRKNAERQIEQIERAQLPKPPAPRSGQPAAPAAPKPLLAPVALAGGAPRSPAASAPPPEPKQPAAVPPPTPRRQQRHDGPPGPGERQVHFLAGGTFDLPGGGQARVNDWINLPEAAATAFVQRGVANFVEVPVPIVGEVDGKLDLPSLTKRKRKADE